MKGYLGKVFRKLKEHKSIVVTVLMFTLMVGVSVFTSVSSHASCNCATCQLLQRYYMMGGTTGLIGRTYPLYPDAEIDAEVELVHKELELDEESIVDEYADVSVNDGIQTQDTTFKVITQNLRVNSAADGEDNSLLERLPRIEEVLKRYEADVYCFQECSTEWKPYADGMMPSSEYESIFMRTNVGHCNPIYVRKSTCTVVDSDSFFISDINPDDYNENRVASCAIVKKNDSNKTMLIVNAHLPVTNDTQDEACKKIMDFVKSKEVDGYVICGDFNFTERGNSQAYEIMTSNGSKDMEEAAFTDGIVGETGPTFHSYGNRENPLKIDFFFGADNVLSTKYSVIKDTVDGKYLSDHYGIYQEATV